MDSNIYDWGCAPSPTSRIDLETILLEADGTTLSKPSIDEDEKDLIEQGVFFEPDDLPIQIAKGADNRCHANTAACWDANRDKCVIATGYALFNDVWMQHSWLMLKSSNSEEEPTIIETTYAAKLYFGILLNNQQSEEFLYNNFH
ncbi:hypothetical protein [Photobacterium leiognathi]|uniref:hypothetical protein n=1 Tax=Photobacterium leiognathi TaxID=553611 RepID=UPI002982B496|nr:hypothetical protein [Photobacterium leiognathi]